MLSIFYPSWFKYFICIISFDSPNNSMLKYFIVHFVEEGTEAQTHEVTRPGHRAESKEFEQSGGFSLFSSPPEIIL